MSRSVTLVALEHRSSFKSLERIALEKGILVEMVRPGGFVVLNADDPLVIGMASRTEERIVTFGRTNAADYRAVRIQAKLPERLTLTVEWDGGKLPLRTNFVAEHFWVSVLAAAATAIEIGVPPELVADRIASFEPIPHRCGMISVADGPDFVVDTVKAPWHSLPLAFDIVASAKAPRKRIVLGQLSDFTGSNKRYAEAYRMARAVADQVIFVGEHSHRSNASEEDIAEGRFMAFDTPLAVTEHLKRTAIPGEVILVKGSGNLHLERIAMSFAQDVKCWIASCGKSQGCVACGLYPVASEIHKGSKSWRRRAQLERILKPWKAARKAPAVNKRA